jgi:hypothetical protein
MKADSETSKDMEQEHERRIEEIIGDLRCSKDFKCYNSGYTDLCKAEDVGAPSFLVCLEKHPRHCKFSLYVEKMYLCECPLRLYLAKEMNK